MIAIIDRPKVWSPSQARVPVLGTSRARSGRLNPAQVNGPAQWLDARFSARDSDTAVGSVSDILGLNGPAIQGTAGSKPSWSNYGLNGQPAFVLDGGDFLAYDALATLIGGQSLPNSGMIVLSPSTGTGNRVAFSIGSSASATPFQSSRATSALTWLVNHSDDAAASNALAEQGRPVAVDRAVVLIWSHDATSIALWVNGRYAGRVATANGAMTVNQVTWGIFRRTTNTSGFAGAMALMALWSNAITEKEAMGLWHYAKRRFRIALA